MLRFGYVATTLILGTAMTIAGCSSSSSSDGVTNTGGGDTGGDSSTGGGDSSTGGADSSTGGADSGTGGSTGGDVGSGGSAGEEGQGGNGPVCSGTPTTCEDLDADSCGEAQGCSAAVCAGPAATCINASEEECVEATHCSWSPEPACSGATPCQIFTNSTTCSAEDDCAWNQINQTMGVCTGVILCDIHDEEACGDYAGCVWSVPSCQGTAAACETLTGDTCLEQPGCELN